MSFLSEGQCVRVSMCVDVWRKHKVVLHTQECGGYASEMNFAKIHPMKDIPSPPPNIRVRGKKRLCYTHIHSIVICAFVCLFSSNIHTIL
mmetsp:Transcript_30590/g.45591  ORF Transcript_30590/g.45591 Transcript_30590/m.45591 type:complete len:90 (-) Transcript_30590:158-427(-)